MDATMGGSTPSVGRSNVFICITLASLSNHLDERCFNPPSVCCSHFPLLQMFDAPAHTKHDVVAAIENSNLLA